MIHHAPNCAHAASLPKALEVGSPAGLAICITLSRTIASRLGSAGERTLTIAIQVAANQSANQSASQSANQSASHSASEQADREVEAALVGDARIVATLGTLDLRERLGLPARARWQSLRDPEHGLTHVLVEGVGEFAQDANGSVAYTRLPALEALGGGRYQIEWSIN